MGKTMLGRSASELLNRSNKISINYDDINLILVLNN